MSNKHAYHGGCFCGAVRYSVIGTPFNATNCHCSICRRTTGAAFVTWFSVRTNEFHILHGQPEQFRSSAHGVRSFCGRCGTQLTFRFSDGNETMYLDNLRANTLRVINEEVRWHPAWGRSRIEAMRVRDA